LGVCSVASAAFLLLAAPTALVAQQAMLLTRADSLVLAGQVERAEALYYSLSRQATRDPAPRTVFRAADEAGDQPTCDLLTQRMQVHEKTAWMLRSLLE
jgi:DNA-binding ferritin-like protein